MKISAIITTYRRFAKCCRAIDAIQRQTVPVDEIIVIDNGSPEPEYATLHDVYAAAAVPVNVVRLSRGTHTQPPFTNNAGQVTSFSCRDITNVGFQLARGDWFATCHDDDEWMPHRIERQVECLQRHPGSLFIGSLHADRTENGHVIGSHPMHMQHPGQTVSEGVADMTCMLHEHNPIAVSTMLIHRNLIRNAGGWQEWANDDLGRRMRKLAASDWDFLRRASTWTRLLRIAEPLVWYEVGNQKYEGHMSYHHL